MVAPSANGYASAYESMPQLLGPDGRVISREAAPGPPYDDYAIPHVITFQSIIGTAQRAYWHDKFDEALRDDRRNALAMRNDPQLMSLLQERILNTAALEWHLEPEDEKDAYQEDITKAMTKIVKSVPRLRRMYRDLMEAVWFGKYAVQVKWTWEMMNALPYLTVAKHTRVNGDKIGHRWDGTPYILVNATEADRLPNSASIFTTAGGRGVLLEGTWRERFILHYHNPDDMDFFQQADMAEAIYGVGVRSRCYFLWWLKQEYISWLAEYLERVGLGMTIWYYDMGNENMRKAVEKEAKDNSRRSNLILPRVPGQGGRGSPGVDRIETPASGSQVLMELQKHLEGQIERFIVGQQASSRSETSGMGTHDTGMQESTQYKITCADADELSETLTGSPREPGLISTIQRYTFPDADFKIRHVFDVDKPDPEQRLNAAKTIVDMGGELKASEVLAAAGFSKPEENDETLGGKEQLMQLAELDAQGKAKQGFGGKEGGEKGKEKPKEGNPFDASDETVDLAKTGAPARYQGELFEESQHPRDDIGRFREAHAAHQKAKSEYREARRKAHETVHGAAKDHLAKVESLFSQLGNLSDNIEIDPQGSDDDTEAFYQTLDEAQSDLRFNSDTPREKWDNLKAVEEAAIAFDRQASGLTEQHEESLAKILDFVKQAKNEMKQLAGRHKEMKAIREGRVDFAKYGIVLKYAKESGRWITIGGKKGEDGKRHGGSPVFIENGRITKGAPSLEGRKIDALKEAPEATGTHRQQVNQHKAKQRALAAKTARKEGIKPDHLHQLAAEIKAHDSEFAKLRKEMLAAARKTMKALGTNIGAIKANVSRGVTEEADQVKGLDIAAQDIADRFPEHFHGHEDITTRLYDLLAEGNPEEMSEEDAYEQALNHLRETSEKIPFEKVRYAAFDESKHPRDDIGQFAVKEGIVNHLRDNGKTGLSELQSALRYAPHDPKDPLAHPVNRALVDLRKSGHVNAHERDWGQPSFSHTGKELEPEKSKEMLKVKSSKQTAKQFVESNPAPAGKEYVYRIQPVGKELTGHQSMTSNDEPDERGVHVFSGLEETFLAPKQWLAPKWKPEIVVIMIDSGDLEDTGDYEGYVVDPSRAKIVHRQAFTSWDQFSRQLS